MNRLEKTKKFFRLAKEHLIHSHTHSTYLIIASIAFIVVIFNLIAIFGLNVLLHDDPLHYKSVIEGKFPWGMMKFFVLWPFSEWMGWSIMTYSPNLARGLYVLLFMVPLSWCFYYLYHNKFGLPRLFAFTAAILPNILPHQWQIPAGINMSRTLYPLLFAMIALILGLHYLEKSTPKNWVRLVGSSLCYLISSQMMEQALFLFPPIVLAFFGYTKLKRKHTWLLSSFFIIAVARYAQMLIFTRKTRILAPIEEILRRTGLYFKYSLPSPDIEPLFLTIFYLCVFLTGFILYVKHPSISPTMSQNLSHMKKRIFTLYLYGFFILWAASTILPFITMGGVIFPPRYPYISAFGINAIFIFSIFVIFNRGFLKKYKLHYFIFAGVIIFSGGYRYLNLNKIFTDKNNIQAIIIRDIEKLSPPKNSQFVICGLPKMAHGRRRVTGYLMHALKRNDVSGIFKTVDPIEKKNFYDHFNPWSITFKRVGQFGGIYSNKPVFFFAIIHKENKLKQFEYVLRWRGRTKNAPWVIIHADKKTGKTSSFRWGEGMGAYLSTIKELGTQGIPRSEILWGGPPTQKESERLERLELDPTLFRFGFYDYRFRFKKIGRSRANKFLSVSNTVGVNSVDVRIKSICFEDGFQLESLFFDEVSEENGKIFKFIHFLWKSVKKQKINHHKLEITFIANGKENRRQVPEFCQTGLELEPGDYISGSVKIPGYIFKKADHLGIRMTMISTSASGTLKKMALKIQGDRETDRDGSRLLIPIN